MADGSTMGNRNFLDYKVIARQAESDVITSFLIAPANGGPVPTYRPGQFLVFRLNIDGGAVLRNYSVSGDPYRPDVLRIAVKREGAPAHRPELPAGLGSNHLHDHVQVGDVLSAAGPMGEFTLAEDSQRPVVLLSGGVGLTPMMSMLHRLVRGGQRRVVFIHACENGRVHAFGDEVLALAQKRPGVSVHFCYRTPTADDLTHPGFHSQGLLAREQLQALLPLDDYDFYLCGPSAFMQANWRLLRGLGVLKQRIHYEFFGPATVLETEDEPDVSGDLGTTAVTPHQREGLASTASAKVLQQQAVSSAADLVQEPAQSSQADIAASGNTRVRFLPSGKTLDWDENCHSLLDLAEQSGLTPDFNCRAGLCNTCMSSLVSGQVEYFEPPLDEPPQGRVLLCCSRPVGPVVIELAN